MATSYTLAELRDPDNPIQPGVSLTLEDLLLPDEDLPIANRLVLGKPHSNAPRNRVSEAHYVDADCGRIIFESCGPVVPVGQYYRRAGAGNWKHYPRRQDAPWNVGGHHKTVIDTEQSNSDWQLSVQIVDLGEMGQRTGKAFLARADHKFPSLQCKSLLFAADLHLPHGRVSIVDAFDHVGTGVGIETGVGDGLYPITLSWDAQGKIDLITINFFPEQGVLPRPLGGKIIGVSGTKYYI
jgi:hypothetical protein